MTTSEPAPVQRNSTGIDLYDHAISLVDSTRPNTPPPAEEDTPEQSISGRSSAAARRIPIGESIPVSRIWSKTGINQELTKRKYARFQEHRYSQKLDTEDIKPKGRAKGVLKSLDDRKGKALEKLRLRPRKAGKAKDIQSAIDILYENQRGLFIFGYPLYSSRSLLNFDPSAWSDAHFQDSAVDIRNAQVPDPTWTWSWKRWYVDMSGDVDEQGWQYSLMFGKKFSWHGTHPWFHSAVRRRRWLRKRVKIQHTGHTKDAHEMTQDYFTIHTPRPDLSRGSSIASRTMDKLTRSSGRFEQSEISDEEPEVDNIVTLLSAMKNTTVDRKKLDAFKSFIEHGGDELQLLPDIIPELWKLFLYQNSRRQLLNLLEDAEHEIDRTGNGLSEINTRRTADLRSAMDLIKDNLNDIEYYSDAKAMGQELDEHDAGHIEIEAPKQNDKQRRLDQVKQSTEPSTDTNIEITRIAFRGIPKEAALDVEPGILRPQNQDKG